MDTNRQQFIERCMRLHTGIVAAVFWSAGFQSADVEDLSQEVFVRAFRAKTLPDNPPAWLRRIALNLACDTARRQARLLWVYESWAERRASIESPIDSVVTELEQSELVQALQDALRNLPSDTQRMACMKMDGCTDAQIAEECGVSVRKVQRVWHSVRLCLEREFKCWAQSR